MYWLIKKCYYSLESIFIRKAEIILQRASGEDSDDLLTDMVNR